MTVFRISGMLSAVVLLALTGCSSMSGSGAAVSQGSVGSCHSFVILSLYEEKLEQEGVSLDLSEKDLFLRVYFRDTSEEQVILQQLVMAADRRLPWTFREGSTLKRAAVAVEKYGVLRAEEEPYAYAFKPGLPMRMNQLRAARVAVYRESSTLQGRLGRSLTLFEKEAIAREQYRSLEKNGVIEALKIKAGDRSMVRRFAGNFAYREMHAQRGVDRLPHIQQLLQKGSVAAAVTQYPWNSGRRLHYGHTVVLRDYDAETDKFMVSNPWWLESFGRKRYDRVDAKELMRYLDTYGWLEDRRLVAVGRNGGDEKGFEISMTKNLGGVSGKLHEVW